MCYVVFVLCARMHMWVHNELCVLCCGMSLMCYMVAYVSWVVSWLCFGCVVLYVFVCVLYALVGLGCVCVCVAI